MSSISQNIPVAVIGAGTMGGGIAQVAASAGHPVLLLDADDTAAERAIEGIGGRLARHVDQARLEATERDAILARVSPVKEIRELAPAGLVIEAVLEDVDVKSDVLAELESVVDGEAIITSNTSSLSITALGRTLDRPARFVGMHFFNPAPVMELVEVVSGLDTDPAIAQCVAETARNWGKAPVLCRSTPGFIVNRVARPFYGEALRIAEEGVADPATVDAVLTGAFGFRMGPFALMDLIGIDVNLAANEGVWRGFNFDPRYAPTALQREMVAAGRLGRKSGRGYFNHVEGAQPAFPGVAGQSAIPRRVVIRGDLGPAKAFGERVAASGLTVSKKSGAPALVIDGHVLALTDGRPATVRHAEDSDKADVLFDLARDYSSATHIAIARAAQAEEAALSAAAGLFQALGMTVCPVGDGAGLIVLRTLAMIANEAMSAVETGVCSPADLDTAMMKGTNWPEGPIAWSERVGFDVVLRAMQNLGDTFRSDRYRAQPLLRRAAAAGQGVL